ncbi:hypothetical protein HOO65_040691 [Ceratocystis lukuohia]|uniref:Uncharacterized protein n=1 Tax=Ceratocystis lukuohia TaxID=2019550 RepID=A0ABR4MJD9_9PEZI
MDVLVPKSSRTPSMSGALDLRDTDITDDIEYGSLFPNSYGTTTLNQRSTRFGKVVQVANENHRSLRAWGRKTFSRNKMPMLDRSESDDTEGSQMPTLSDVANVKLRPRLHRRKSFSGLFQAMATMMAKDTPGNGDPEAETSLPLDVTRTSTPVSEETMTFDKIPALVSTPIEYLPKTREKSECSSTFRHCIDDAVKMITGEGLGICDKSADSTDDWSSNFLRASRAYKTPLNTPTASIFEISGQSTMGYQACDGVGSSNQLITLVLPPRDEDTQCDAYHLYFSELFAFLGACPPSFSVLGIYDASHRVYYLQPPTSFDSTLKEHAVHVNEEPLALKTLPAGLRRFLSEIPTERTSSEAGSDAQKKARTTGDATSIPMASIGVETEPAMKKRLRSDITEILRLLVAHQEERINEINKKRNGPSEIEMLRDDVRKRLGKTVEAITELMGTLSPLPEKEALRSVEATTSTPPTSGPAASIDATLLDSSPPTSGKAGKPSETVSPSSRAATTAVTTADIPPPKVSAIGASPAEEGQEVQNLAEASPCRTGMTKLSHEDGNMFIVPPSILERRCRVPCVDSDHGELDGAMQKNRGRSLSGTGPFFTGSWRHEAARADHVSPFRASRLVHGNADTDGSVVSGDSEGSLDMMAEAILIANGTLNID